MAVKHYRDLNVHDAAKARLRLVFQHFERVCVAFSGGKDSSVTLHLALEVAREMKRGPVHAVFIDLEGQYQATIAHVTEMFDRPDVQPWWVCLPINLRNASSLREPYWCAWEPGREADWIRPLPSHPSVISDPARFPFYRHRMEFEEFVPEFNRWLARDASTAFLVGIRSDESLNRYLAVKRRTKKCAWTPPGAHKPLPWSTSDKSGDGGVTFFPIYDWKFEDLWRYTGEHGHAYNRLYDQMLRAGVAFSQMRICQPYGDDQRKGLDLFHKLEPATWFRTVRRVEGANYAARYCRQRFLGYRGGLGLPPPSAPGANTASSCSTACRPRCARSTRGASMSSSSGGSNAAIPFRCGRTRAFPISRTARRNRHGGASACRCSSRTWRAPCRSAPPGAISTPCFPPSPAPSHDPSPEALRIRTTALVRRRAGLLRPDGPLLRQRQRQARLRRLPLSDGPRYLWFIVRRHASKRVLGFISIELLSGEVRIRDGYVRPEARQLGLFRALRQRVLEYIDALNQPCVLRVPWDCAALLQPYGFQVHLTRGNWATLKRNTHATRSEPDEPGPAPVQRTAEPAAARADRSHQPDPPMPA